LAFFFNFALGLAYNIFYCVLANQLQLYYVIFLLIFCFHNRKFFSGNGVSTPPRKRIDWWRGVTPRRPSSLARYRGLAQNYRWKQ